MMAQSKRQKEAAAASTIFDRRAVHDKCDRRQQETDPGYLNCRRKVERRHLLRRHNPAWWLNVEYAEWIDEMEFLKRTKKEAALLYSQWHPHK